MFLIKLSLNIFIKEGDVLSECEYYSIKLMDRRIYFKNSKIKFSPINACSQSKIVDKQLIGQNFIKSSKK
ncbi:hypothetical protein UT300005_00970 [Clostridium sp. CTA-5]